MAGGKDGFTEPDRGRVAHRQRDAFDIALKDCKIVHRVDGDHREVVSTTTDFEIAAALADMGVGHDNAWRDEDAAAWSKRGDTESVGAGKSESVSVDLGGGGY